MDDYSSVNISSLKFKGEKKKKKHKSHKNPKPSQEGAGPSNERLKDAEEHGGWWKVDKIEQIKGDLAIEFVDGIYAKALADGSIVLGNPHPPGEGPDEEEIFTPVCASSNQIALKSGFMKYLSVDSKKRIVGLSDAIGEKEMFLPVFENNETALSTYNDYFLTHDEEGDNMIVVARSTTVGVDEKLELRVNYDPKSLEHQKSSTTADSGTVYEAELNYLKMYQARGESHVNIDEDRKGLKRARVGGELHEALLEKRSKQKSDKYCK